MPSPRKTNPLEIVVLGLLLPLPSLTATAADTTEKPVPVDELKKGLLTALGAPCRGLLPASLAPVVAWTPRLRMACCGPDPRSE